MKKKKVIILTIILIIFLLLAVLLYNNKKIFKNTNSNSCQTGKNYYAFIINDSVEDKLLINSLEYDEEISKLDAKIAFDKNIFTNNNYYMHTEIIDYCDKTSIDQIIKDIKYNSAKNNVYDIYIKESCCTNPSTKYLLLFIKEKDKNDSKDEIEFKRHRLYNSCKNN